MSLSAGCRFSGFLGTAPQMSVVHPILNFLVWAAARTGSAAAPKPARRVVPKALRVSVLGMSQSFHMFTRGGPNVPLRLRGPFSPRAASRRGRDCKDHIRGCQEYAVSVKL